MPASLFLTANCFRRSGAPTTAIKPTTSASSSLTCERRSSRIPRSPSTSSPSPGSATVLRDLPNPDQRRQKGKRERLIVQAEVDRDSTLDFNRTAVQVDDAIAPL